MKASIKDTISMIVLLSIISPVIAEEQIIDWKPVAEFQAYLQSQREINDGKIFPPRHWVTKVDGRFIDGEIELRCAYKPVPHEGPYTWFWWYFQNEQTFQENKVKYKERGLYLVHEQSFALPDGETLYQGVWHSGGTDIPTIDMTTESNMMMSIYFTGTLQFSTNLSTWSSLSPQPESPYIVTHNSDQIFFRTLKE